MPRLDVLLARNLDLSRRRVKGMLRSKRVTDLDGSQLDDGAMALPPSELPIDVRVDGQPHTLHHRYSVLLNKPLGVITAQADARHEVAYDCVRDAPLARELRGVGRLDKDTSGLLLWTTDGTLLHKLTHPRYGVPRTYHAGLIRPFADPPAALALDDGHAPQIERLEMLSPEQLHPALRRTEHAEVFATITIRTGRFHEVRRIFAALGSEVLDLCRVSFGDLALPPELSAGAWQPVDLHAHFSGLSPRAAAGGSRSGTDRR